MYQFFIFFIISQKAVKIHKRLAKCFGNNIYYFYESMTREWKTNSWSKCLLFLNKIKKRIHFFIHHLFGLRRRTRGKTRDKKKKIILSRFTSSSCSSLSPSSVHLMLIFCLFCANMFFLVNLVCWKGYFFLFFFGFTLPSCFVRKVMLLRAVWNIFSFILIYGIFSDLCYFWFGMCF